MTSDDLKSALQNFYDARDVIGVSVYAVLKGQEGSPRKIDIESKAMQGLKDLFLQSLRDSITERDDLRKL